MYNTLVTLSSFLNNDNSQRYKNRERTLTAYSAPSKFIIFIYLIRRRLSVMFKSFKNNIFDVLSNRILIWYDVNCMRFRCSCYRMFIVYKTLKMRIIASSLLLTLTYNNCWRHYKSYRYSSNSSSSSDNSYIKMKKSIAYMCISSTSTGSLIWELHCVLALCLSCSYHQMNYIKSKWIAVW